MSRNKVIIEESVIRVVTVGIQGPPGLQGVPGEQGPAGEAIAPGGAAGEFLKKINENDNGTAWAAIEESDVSGLEADLAGKEPSVAPGTSSQYYRGDKTFQTLNKGGCRPR